MRYPKHAKRRRIAAVTVAATLGTAGALISATAGSSSATPLASSSGPGSSPGGQVTVPQGIGPAVLEHATPLGDTPGDTPETVSFILQGRDLGGLKATVESGNSPDLSVSQFAAALRADPQP